MSYSRVFFDLEHSSMPGATQILQVAAKVGQHTFNEYVTPTHPIPYHATQVNRLQSSGDGRLFKDGMQLCTSHTHDVLARFISFLGQFQNPILIAHGQSDFVFLARAANKAGYFNQLVNVVYKCADTVPIFQSRANLGSYKLMDIAHYLNVSTHGSHDALTDCIILENCCSVLGISVNDFLSHSSSISSYI